VDPDIAAQLAVAEDQIRERLTQTVRAARRAAHLTQKAAATRGGMHWRHLQKIEHGQVNATVQTLASLTVALAVDVSDLFHAPARPEAPAAHALPNSAVPSVHAVAEQIVRRWRVAKEGHVPPGMGELIAKLEIALAFDGMAIAAARAEERARTLTEVSAVVLAALSRISGASSTP
jgi:transcriptional regulator with XRE-family HTH domain